MTNSDRGDALVSEILATLADEYDWPDFRAPARVAIPMTAAGLADFAGRYQPAGLLDTLVITVEEGRLFARITRLLPRTELLAESSTRLFTRDQGLNFDFEREGDRVVAVRVQGRRAVKQP
jgi:hypothetical protein